jgi:hypothetical protein
MRLPAMSGRCLAAVVCLLLSACSQNQLSSIAGRSPLADILRSDPDSQAGAEGGADEVEDHMADVPGDQRFPPPGGKVEQLDCKAGVEDEHARLALEARGGEVSSFAFYSKRKPRTCSLDVSHNTPGVKWRKLTDGSTRVQTVHGQILIYNRRDGYEFRFQNVDRRKICGMEGQLNGTMTITRKGNATDCSVAGLMEQYGAPQSRAEWPLPSRR